MNYSSIRKMEVSNGEGIRVSLFVSGCTLHCPNCFNPEAQNFCAGHEFGSKEFFRINELLKKPYCAGLSLLGGEPFDQKDNFYLLELCKVAHSLGKTVWAWSGHLFDEIRLDPVKAELLENCDVLVDGPFVDAQKDLSLAWRGSANQRVIDVCASLKKGEVILYEK